MGKPLNSSLLEPSVTNMGHMFALFIQAPSGSRYTQPGPGRRMAQAAHRGRRFPRPADGGRRWAARPRRSFESVRPAPKKAAGQRRAVHLRSRSGMRRASPAGGGGGRTDRGRPRPPLSPCGGWGAGEERGHPRRAPAAAPAPPALPRLAQLAAASAR